MLYGTTIYGGTNNEGAVFKVSTIGTGYTLLHSFTTNGSDGRYPYAGLIQGQDGSLYGTTEYGGSGGNTTAPFSGQGTIYKLNTDGTGYSVLHSFTTNSVYLGTPDGQYPSAGLVQAADGTLFGTTLNGGYLATSSPGSGYGTAYRINTNGTSYSVIFFFGEGGGVGVNPFGGLIQGHDGSLYGTTEYGAGGDGNGTVFQLRTNATVSNPDNVYATLYNFGTAGMDDGERPSANLVQGLDFALYGTTIYGGSGGGYGTVFKVNTNGTGYSILYSFTFNVADDYYQEAGLMQGSDGALYGISPYGGQFQEGLCI